MALTALILRPFYEWMAKNKSYADLLAQFQKNETTVYGRMVNAGDSNWNRTRAVHVIGIERWGTHRLRVLLGEPLIIDEYDGYAPSEQLSMAALAEEFKQSRATLVALVRELQSKGVALTQTVKHNEVGDLSLRGWLFYLENHIGRETMVLRQDKSDKPKPITES